LDTNTSNYTSASLDCVIANLGQRAVANSKEFEYWRFRRLKVRSVPAQAGAVDYTSSGGAGFVHAIGFSPIPFSDLLFSPATFTDLGALNCMDLQPGYKTAQFNVPSGLLNSIPLKWARTRSTSSTTDELSRGCVYFLVNATTTETSVPMRTWFELEGQVEFSGQVADNDSLESHPDRSLLVIRECADDEKKSDSGDGIMIPPLSRGVSELGFTQQRPASAFAGLVNPVLQKGFKSLSTLSRVSSVMK